MIFCGAPAHLMGVAGKVKIALPGGGKSKVRVNYSDTGVVSGQVTAPSYSLASNRGISI